MREKGYKVSIIIPHYNQKEPMLRILLPSLAIQTFGNYEVIIIDDCSTDKSVVEYIKSFVNEHENMRLVENTENMRFVKTANKGIKLASGEYICLLNSDTEVRRNFIERNVEILDADPSIAALSCIIVDRNGKNWFSGGILKSGSPINLNDEFEGIRPVDFVAGTAAFYRKEIFDKIGLFDEKYSMYHEDVEYGLRIKAHTSYKACVFSEKLVVHYTLGSIGYYKILYLGHRNHILILRKYFPKYIPRILLYYLVEMAGSVILAVLKLRPGYLFYPVCIIRGALEGLIERQNQ